MKAVIASDLHLTDNERDAHRFGIFKFLRSKIKKYKPNAVLILGDLTDNKDKHPSTLVNKIIHEIVQTAALAPVYLLKGNHDYLDEGNPFFLFCNNLKSKHRIRYISQPTPTKIGGSAVLFLPHTRDPEKAWGELDCNGYDYVFLHQTLKGARASSGQSMEGVSSNMFDDCVGTVISGDIHVPQKIGKVTYVGSPYHITFGDSFKPRCILVNEAKITSLRFDTISMHTVVLDDPEELMKYNKIKKGDYLKARIELKNLDELDWANKKQRVMEIGQQLGLGAVAIEFIDSRKTKKVNEHPEGQDRPSVNDPLEVFTAYCDGNKIEGKLRDVGEQLLQKA